MKEVYPLDSVLIASLIAVLRKALPTSDIPTCHDMLVLILIKAGEAGLELLLLAICGLLLVQGLAGLALVALPVTRIALLSHRHIVLLVEWGNPDSNRDSIRACF